MKFLPKSIPKIDMLKFSPSTIVAGVLTFFAVMTVIIIISGVFLGSQGRIENALLSSQRLEVDLDNGEIFGTVLKTDDLDNAGKDAEKSESPKAITDNSSRGKVEHFAWLDEDFIGPRMPKSFIEVLTEGVVSNIKIKKVSIKELSDKPVIVVILKGLGLSASTTESALELPPSVTFGLSPYSSSIKSWAKKAKEQGREIVLNIPMETRDYRLNDPGPYALLTQSSKEDNITRLNMLLGLVDGYKAVYSNKEEIFTHTIASSKPILKELKKKGKYFVFGGGYADFSLVQLANEMEYPLLVNDFILDSDISEKDINDKFQEIEAAAVEKGYVVVMAHPYPITIRMLERWIPMAESRGFYIAPISLLLGKNVVKE